MKQYLIEYNKNSNNNSSSYSLIVLNAHVIPHWINILCSTNLFICYWGQLQFRERNCLWSHRTITRSPDLHSPWECDEVKWVSVATRMSLTGKLFQNEKVTASLPLEFIYYILPCIMYTPIFAPKFQGKKSSFSFPNPIIYLFIFRYLFFIL